jgi:hypothetical protein
MDPIPINHEQKQPSAKQIAANRANSLKSTGPKTIPGKERSSMNAIKHGLCAKKMILAGESEAECNALIEQLWAGLKPRNTHEELLVKEIIHLTWRLDRFAKVEAEIFTRKGYSFTGIQCGSQFAFINDAQGLDAFGKLSRYEGPMARLLFKWLKELRELQKQGWATKADDGEQNGHDEQPGNPPASNSGPEHPDSPNPATTDPDPAAGPDLDSEPSIPTANDTPPQD